MPAGLNPFDREEYLFRYLADHCVSDNAAAGNPGRWQPFTSYGALVGGKAVCEGYSRAMQLLAGCAGILCTLVRGSGDGVGHMWNAVRIGSAWYHLDVTWSDNAILIYNYYNVSDSVIRQTHGIGPTASSLSDHVIDGGAVQFNIFLPSCSSTAENYFRVKGIPVSALNGSGDEAVVKALASELKTGRKSIAFLIHGNYNGTVAGMMTASPYKMASWLRSAEKQAGKPLNIGASSYVTDPADSGLTLQVVYR
jgi:hypothetical protein